MHTSIKAQHRSRKAQAFCRRAGFTLLEVVISTMLTGVVILAALNTLGAASRASLDSSYHARAVALAEELMAEIMNQPYLDPDGGSTFGTESGESASTRADFDDVDDYDEWSASPPQDKAGNTIPNGTDWSRTVYVRHCNPDDPTQTLSDSDDRGLKAFSVTVRYQGEVKASLKAGTTSAWPPRVE